MLKATAVVAAAWCLITLLDLVVAARQPAYAQKTRLRNVVAMAWWVAWSVTAVLLALWLTTLLFFCSCSPVWDWAAVVSVANAAWWGLCGMRIMLYASQGRPAIALARQLAIWGLWARPAAALVRLLAKVRVGVLAWFTAGAAMAATLAAIAVMRDPALISVSLLTAACAAVGIIHVRSWRHDPDQVGAEPPLAVAP